MKIKFILNILIALVLTSCKKDRLCTCVSSTHKDGSRFYGTKKDSRQHCQDYEKELERTYPGTTCTFED